MGKGLVISSRDYEFFCKLASVYTALAHSVCDPVFLRTGKPKPFDRIFYSCADDEKEAERVMLRRITNYGSDIKNYLRMHERLNNLFYTLEEQGINIGNRENVSLTAREMIIILKGLSEVVEGHLEKCSRPFLAHTYCPSGHFFKIGRHGQTLYKSFNLAKDLSGLEEELENLKKEQFAFMGRGDEFPAFKISDDYDHGEGIRDTGLRGRLELTKELLRRAGMVEV